eukprot:Seg1533.2 transcript_id=Seg1533.2/GoldUCD/mRNA.D3Y31 product="Protein cornichon 4" protein_id=Seg1533.2/GoldUCD/D3Y31
MNKVVIPEIVAHGLMTVLILSTLHLLPIVVNLPMTVWVVYRLLSKSKGDTEFYDPAEIHNRNHLKSYMKEALVKLGYNLLAFFVYLYCMVMEINADSENTS